MVIKSAQQVWGQFKLCPLWQKFNIETAFSFYLLRATCHFDYIFASCLFGQAGERGSEEDSRERDIVERGTDMRRRECNS